MPIEYIDYDLRISQDQQIFARSGRGEAGPCAFTLDQNEIGLALQIIQSEGANPDLVRETGRKLYQALFPEEIHLHFQASQAASPQGRLRIRLMIEPEDLAVLPWELIYDGENFLALGVETLLVRYPEISEPLHSLKVQGPLKVLILIASPSNYPDLHGEAHAEELKNIFSPLQTEGLLEVDFLLHATYANLIHHLRNNEYHVLHYFGYSAFDAEKNSPVLILEEGGGIARKITGEELAGLLYREDLVRSRQDERSLRMVVINDCEASIGPEKNYSTGVARSLVRAGLPAILAMQYSLPDQVAWKFAAEFYGAIIAGLPVDAAAARGRTAILAASEEPGAVGSPDRAVPGEWCAPVVFLHAEDSQLLEPRVLPPTIAARSTQQIYREIDEFKVETRDLPTRLFLDHLPTINLVAALGLLVYWLTSRRLDPLFVSGVITVLICIWLLRSLFRNKVPETLDKLWRRRILASRGDQDLAAEYLDYLKSYNALLNHSRFIWVTRSIGLAVAIYSSLYFNFKPIPSPWQLPLRLLVYLLVPFAGYILGTLLWKMLATVIATSQLSYRFDLIINPSHPDSCGGLKSLGDLYFSHAAIVLVAGLFVAAWVFILSISQVILARHLAANFPEQAALVTSYPALCSGPSTASLPPDLCTCVFKGEGLQASVRLVYTSRCLEHSLEPDPNLVVLLSYNALGYYRWLGLYLILLVILAVIAVITFLYPLKNTHNIMSDKGDVFRSKADSMSAEISELERYIDKHGMLGNEEMEEIRLQLQWLTQRYNCYSSPPLWPYDARVRFRMLTSLLTMGGSFLLPGILPSVADFLRRFF